MNDLSDVLTRIRQVPLPALVAELRALHQNHPAPEGRRPPAPSTDALAPVLELLRRATSAATTMPVAPAPAPAALAPAPARDERYALLQRHFGGHELELRHHARLTERILDQLAQGELASSLPTPAVLQQEVRVVCAPGATSGARFLLRNDLGRTVLLTLRVRPLRDADALDGLSVGCEPQRIELAADAEILARIHVDLTRCPPVVPENALELVVDALVDDEVVQKIWVALTVRAARQVDGAGTP